MFEHGIRVGQCHDHQVIAVSGAGITVTGQSKDATTMNFVASWISKLLQNKQNKGPYLLPYGDSNETLITHIQLRGYNYDEWMHHGDANCTASQKEKKKNLGFVDSSLTRPNDDSSDLEDW